jgi:histidinol-phosphatase (PHP family)
VLEINTTRGIDRARGLCPGLDVLHWWHQLGGRAISFGSDSHEPAKIARGFRLAAEVAEAAGFKPGDDPAAFWRR